MPILLYRGQDITELYEIHHLNETLTNVRIESSSWIIH